MCPSRLRRHQDRRDRIRPPFPRKVDDAEHVALGARTNGQRERAWLRGDRPGDLRTSTTARPAPARRGRGYRALAFALRPSPSPARALVRPVVGIWQGPRNAAWGAPPTPPLEANAQTPLRRP